MSMHYKRITTVAIMAVFAIGLTTCKKEIEEKIDPPIVKAFEGAIIVNYNKASVSAEVTDQGGAEVKSKGFVYGLSGGNHDTIFCGSGTGVYSAELNNLEPNTTYVYEAFAKNAGGFGTSGKISFTTKPVPTYTIDVSADPSHGGTATGGGTFQEGQSCTVKATPNTGFNFVNWKENDVQVSTNSEYSFEVTASRNLVAHFTSQAYTIIASPEPEEGGNVSGSGGYNYGDLCTLSATDNPGYAFVEWTENGTQVSTHRDYTFEVTGSRNLVAHFTQQTYTITATAEPEEYGTVSVSGNGEFHYNDQCTLTATANQGYSFVNWTKNGIPVSTQASWTFTVTESAEYVAHFQIAALNLTVSANPEVIAKGSSSQLNATASNGNGSFTYRWTPSTGLSNTNIQNPTATPNTTTTYTCTVTSGSQTASNNCKVEVVCPPTLNNPTVNGNSVYLSWTAVNPATSYKVYRGNTMIAQNVTTTSYTDNNLSPGTYTYQVSTVYSNVESPKSDLKQATISSGDDQTFTVNGVSFTMKCVVGGTFWMGAQSTNSNGQNYDSDAYGQESPVHSVTVSTFYMGETEVTQALWQAVMGNNPSYFSGSTRPVEQVSWNTIVNSFIPALNALTGRTFRLPTEAEWEYAARGGNQSHGYKYAGSNTIGNVAWYSFNSGSQTHPVATKSPNELGLYDMSGNVGEWCSDWYGSYGSGSQTNPQGPTSGSGRVLRGGSWNSYARSCRVSCRLDNTPGYSDSNRGFRLVLSQ